MRIRIDADGHHFTILFPIGIILNGFATRIITSCLKKYANVPFTEEQMSVLLKELRQAKKTFSKLPLVDVRPLTVRKC